MTRQLTGRRSARGWCVLAALVVVPLASGLAGEEAPRTTTNTAADGQHVRMPEGIGEARLLLAARRPRQAAALLGKKLESMPQGSERAIVEWYLGLAESAGGNDRGARRTVPTKRYTFASDADNRRFFELLSRTGETRAPALSWWWLLAPRASLLTALAGGSENPVGDVAGFLSKAKQQRADDASIENEIRFGTWSLLFAELLAESPDLALWSRAVDAFEEGSEALGRIEAAIDKDPSLEERISALPELAMRLDAARVRQGETEERQRLARDQEHKRLEQLRRIVRAYRDATHEFALFTVHSTEGNQQAVQAATLVAMKHLASVGEIAAERNDAHLFDDEPGLDETAALTAKMPAPEPFSVDTIAFVKGLQSLADYYLATPLSGDPKLDLLKRAQAWAQAALGENVELDLPESPPGPDPASPLAHWALALAREGLGRAKLAPAPANAEARRLAAQDFDDARAHFARALELLTANDPNGAARADFIEKVKAAKERLDGPAAFLVAADRLTQQGQPRAAWELLREALERNGDGPIWLARAEYGRRGRADYGKLFQELDEAVQATIVDGAVAQTALVRAKIELDQFWQRLVEQPPAPGETAELKVALAATIKKLRTARDATAEDAALRAQLDACLGLALSYDSMVSGKADETLAAEGYRLAREAAAALEQLLAQAESPAAQLPLREALIASRLAQGHLALAILPDYRDEPLLAFSAAFDEAAKVPFVLPGVKALGSPLLAALSRRPGEAGNMLGREERHRREMMTRFVEASFSLQFGAAGAAAEQMSKALQVSQQPKAAEGTMPDAARLLAEADGFEAPRTLADSMHAFQALAAVAAGHADAAAVSLVHFTLPDAAVHNLGDVNTALVGRAVERIQSPLVGYAFALALEATLDSLSPRDTKAVVARSRQAQAAYRQTAELLKSLQLAGRYPHLVELTRQMGQRLAQADYFVGRAATLRRRGDLDGATRELLRGLRRNPASAELWQAYAQARLDRLKRQQGDADFDDLLAEIDAAARQGLVADYQRQVIHGAVHEERGQEQAALAAYLRATRAAANAEQKVFAQSKAGALRARVAMAVRERE